MIVAKRPVRNGGAFFAFGVYTSALVWYDHTMINDFDFDAYDTPVRKPACDDDACTRDDVHPAHS